MLCDPLSVSSWFSLSILSFPVKLLRKGRLTVAEYCSFVPRDAGDEIDSLVSAFLHQVVWVGREELAVHPRAQE